MRSAVAAGAEPALVGRHSRPRTSAIAPTIVDRMAAPQLATAVHTVQALIKRSVFRGSMVEIVALIPA